MMMTTNKETVLDANIVSEKAIDICVNNAVLKTEGVYDFFGGFSDTLSKNFLRKELKYKGIKIVEMEDGLDIDIYVIVNYGVKIPDIAWELQNNVKTAVDKILENPIMAVNVHIQGVHCSEKEGE